MTTLREQHVKWARRYNWAMVRFKITGWTEQADQMRTLRDDHMRRARNAGGEL